MAEKRPYLFTVSRGQLCPFDAHAESHLAKFADGTVLKCANLVQPRCIPFQGYYWATLANVVENTGIAPTADHLHDALVKLCGYVSIVTDIHGKPIDMVRDSTAFDKMDEPAFHEYVDHAQRVLAERFGITWDEYTLKGKAA